MMPFWTTSKVPSGENCSLASAIGCSPLGLHEAQLTVPDRSEYS